MFLPCVVAYLSRRPACSSTKCSGHEGIEQGLLHLDEDHDRLDTRGKLSNLAAGRFYLTSSFGVISRIYIHTSLETALSLVLTLICSLRKLKRKISERLSDPKYQLGSSAPFFPPPCVGRNSWSFNKDLEQPTRIHVSRHEAISGKSLQFCPYVVKEKRLFRNSSPAVADYTEIF